MALLARYPISVAIVAIAVAATLGFFVFARPEFHRQSGVSIKLPAKHPAEDASGAAGWVWPDGVPGWRPGQTIKGVNISGLQPVEIQAAQLGAARNVLDAERVRVVAGTRPNTEGVLAILAAPTLYQTPVKTCLAALLQGNAPVEWECPGATPSRHDLAHARVLVAAASYTWPPASPGGHPRHVIYLAGVARGDVYRIVLAGPGLEPQTLYTRGTTWGQFDAAATVPRAAAHLAIYDRKRLVETLPLNVQPGRTRDGAIVHR